jgi:tetratricopeptide (TPR) repeat protein
MANEFLGDAYYYSRDYDHAIEQQLKTLELGPGDADLHDSLGNSYLMRGDNDEAAREYAQSLILSGNPTWAKTLNRAYAKGGIREVLKTQITFWSDPTRSADYDPDSVAKNYSLLHDRENAFVWLQRAYDDREKVRGGALMDVAVNPQFDYIRSDPRFRRLLLKLGFPESVTSSHTGFHQ